MIRLEDFFRNTSRDSSSDIQWSRVCRSQPTFFWWADPLLQKRPFRISRTLGVHVRMPANRFGLPIMVSQHVFCVRNSQFSSDANRTVQELLYSSISLESR